MRRIAVVAVVPLLFGAASCGQGSQDPEGGSGGSCPLTLVYRADTYYPYQTEKPVEPGRPIAEVRHPPCDDFGGGIVDSDGQVTDELTPDEDAATGVDAYTIAGVKPAVAFVVPSSYRRTLFFSSSHGTEMPPEVERLLSR